ncbi:MAG: MFS transporter [Promethearchaeati archaeon SRVP18_Atabeyarchaeia-1]
MPRRFFLTICIMGLFAILSSTMSKTPVLNPFAASLGTPAYLMGFVAAASTIPGILVSLPAGLLSDRLGRGKVIVFAGVIFATAPFLYLLVVDPYQLILVRFYHGFATAILVPVANAAIVERYPGSRGEKIATFSSSTAIGRAIAPVLGGYILLVTISDYHELYTLVGLSGVLALILAVGLHEGRKTEEPNRSAANVAQYADKARDKISRNVFQDWKEVASNRRILLASLAEAAIYYVYGAFEFYLVPFAHLLNIDDLLIGVILTSEIATFVLAKPIMGRFSDKIGRKKPIVLGLALGAAPMLAMQFAVSFPELILVSVTYGLGFSLVTSSTPPLVSEACRKEVYGSAMGFLGTIMDVGQALGPIVTGFILAATSMYSISFLSLGLVLLAAAIIFSL